MSIAALVSRAGCTGESAVRATTRSTLRIDGGRQQQGTVHPSRKSDRQGRYFLEDTPLIGHI
jgi:uncharacterized protein (DUF2141 family)